MLKILLMTAVAGTVGMGLGALVAAFLGKVSERIMCWMLSFAGGVMISIVSFELVPESIDIGGVPVAILGIVLGSAIVLALHRALDALAPGKLRSLATPGDVRPVGSESLLKSGIIMLVAISLHNVPEGIAIGAAGASDMALGAVLALIIALHCIPEGMAVAAPLIGGGMRRARAVGLTALSGATTIAGGAIGMAVGGISDVALALALSGAGGAMLYVVFSEILPQSALIAKSRFTSVA
ncbi:MAG: ZIP family metal transporter, partial [Treponema sp.]|nr:ZIP family metal transporter [Treponema sp.]